MKNMKKTIAFVLAVMMMLALCACGKTAASTPAATEAPAEQSAADANAEASQSVAAEQNQAGAVIGIVSHLSTSRMLVVEAEGNVYCFDIPIDTDTTNMVADNVVTVTFNGQLDPSLGTAFQNVTVTGISFAELPEIVEVGAEAAQAEVAATPDPSTQAATQTAEGNAIMYMWKDGTVHDTPEEGMATVTQAQVAKIQFEEPQLVGKVNSCNGTIIGIVEDGKYIVLDDGAGHQFMFYIEGKSQVSYDGTPVSMGANCSVLYIGTLNPYYGASTPQYVTVQDVQTDSKAYYYSVISKPQTTSAPSNTPGPNGMWYGTDGKIHWYGSDGKVYNYDSKGNIVLS